MRLSAARSGALHVITACAGARGPRQAHLRISGSGREARRHSRWRQNRSRAHFRRVRALSRGVISRNHVEILGPVGQARVGIVRCGLRRHLCVGAAGGCGALDVITRSARTYAPGQCDLRVASSGRETARSGRDSRATAATVAAISVAGSAGTSCMQHQDAGK